MPLAGHHGGSSVACAISSLTDQNLTIFPSQARLSAALKKSVKESKHLKISGRRSVLVVSKYVYAFFVNYSQN